MAEVFTPATALLTIVKGKSLRKASYTGKILRGHQFKRDINEFISGTSEAEVLPACIHT